MLPIYVGHLHHEDLELYISNQIVNFHGGQLKAGLPSEGGTRFVVSLPSGLG